MSTQPIILAACCLLVGCHDADLQLDFRNAEGVPTHPTRSVEEWAAAFEDAMQSGHADNVAASLSEDSWQFYGLGYSVDGATSAFEATGNTEYLDAGLEYAQNMIATAQTSSSFPTSQFGDDYLGWLAWSHPEGTTDGEEVPLFESFCWRYVTRLLRAVRENPSVYQDRAYRAAYDEILAFTETHMFEKWITRGESNIYRSRTHMASHWAFMALDLSLLTQDDARREQYRQVFDNFNHDLPNYDSSMREQLVEHPASAEAYFWSAEWEQFDPPGQDVAHGNAVISFMVEARDHGCEYDDVDMQKMVVLLDEIIWPEALEGVADYVDGSGDGNGWFNDGFIKLGRYSPELQARLEGNAVGRNMQHYGALAHNAKVLEDGGEPPNRCGLRVDEPDPGGSEAGTTADPGGDEDAAGESTTAAGENSSGDAAATTGGNASSGLPESSTGTAGSGAADSPDGGGCTCRSQGGLPRFAAVLLLLPAVRRRRRSA